MKIMSVAIMLAASVAFAPAQNSAPKKGKTVRVKIYLLDFFESENLFENMRMQPVEREVRAASPLRSTIEALLAGATDDEQSSLRLFSPAAVGDVKLIRSRIKNKTAYLSFEKGSVPFSEIDALRFRKAVRLTARQFPSVRRVRVCLNGIADFWRIGSDDDKPRRKCR